MFWLLYRFRGTANPHLTTTEARLIYWTLPWAIVSVLLALMYGLPWWAGLISGVVALFGMMIGHGFAQGDSKPQYADMGLVAATRLGEILLPLIIVAGLYHQPIPWSLALAAPASFFLFWEASSLSYSPIFQTRPPLVLFGQTLCVQGDSSWEELLVGAGYDVAVAALVALNYMGPL